MSLLPRRRKSEQQSHEPAGPRINVRHDFYSPVPRLHELPAEVWERRSELAGIEFDTAAQVGWAERELAGAIAAFQAPDGFHLDNSYFEAADAEICDAIVRWARPQRVVELGSGWSTLILRGAAGADRVETYDPFPAGFLTGVNEVSATDVELGVFDALEAGDVLFVDTSHTVKLGGEVNRIVLEILPRLAPGVIVHVHDIWLPYEYHRVLVEEMEMYWAEQYLLQAFLIGNAGWEVLFACQAVAREHPERMQALVPSYDGTTYPSSFWMRRLLS